VARPIAVLVEDDPEQAAVSLQVLNAVGFEIRAFDAVAPVLDYLQRPPELVDLFVLDRRLPVQVGQPASDELGDELLDEVRSRFHDARIIVFTGFASIQQVQNVARGSGQLPSHLGEAIDRVSALQKSQTLEFRAQVQLLWSLLQSIDDIEIILVGEGSPSMGPIERRMLQRLAHHYGAVSLTVRPLGGGLTGAAVWLCEREGREGSLGPVVVKQIRPDKQPQAVFAELVPRSCVATRIDTVSGLMSGESLAVFQVAGQRPVPLMDLIATDPDHAADIARPIGEALRAVPAQRRVLSLAELCAPIVEWSKLKVLLEQHQIDVPPDSLKVSADVAVRHCDLHPGNLLDVDGHGVLIDFDDAAYGAGGIDPITLLLSTLAHRDSPIRGAGWPNVSHIEATFGTRDFGAGHSCATWFKDMHDWIEQSCVGRRERWGLTLAYAGKQLKYRDVYSEPDVLVRVAAVARRASAEIVL
jgi:ActR/RegA family two-component response regulator